MSLYSAPRPPRKRPQPRVANSGRFRAVEPLDDPALFDFVRESHGALVRAAQFLERVPIPGDETAAGQVRAFVVAYLTEVAETIGEGLVVDPGRAWSDQS